MRSNLLIAKHLDLFNEIYDEEYRNSGSKILALQFALSVLKKSPRFNVLTGEELNSAAEILKDSDDPRRVINKIVSELDHKKAIQAFRDQGLLRKLSRSG